MNNALCDAFRECYRVHNLPGQNQPLIRDGIINPARYAAQRVKILLVAKEHNFVNRTGNPGGYEGDYRTWWNQQVYLRFSHRISEWCFGLLNQFQTPYEAITYEQKLDALSSIAFINVKKTGGGAQSATPTILAHIEASKSLLHQQIAAINPDVIVCCFHYDFYVNALFERPMTRAGSGRYSTGTWLGKPLINFYHPSARKSKALLFSQFAEAVKAVELPPQKEFIDERAHESPNSPSKGSATNGSGYSFI